jgi:hypothetical protein
MVVEFEVEGSGIRIVWATVPYTHVVEAGQRMASKG